MKKFIKTVYRKFFPINIKGADNKVEIGCKFKNFTLDIIGDSNRVVIDKTCLLTNTHISIFGNHCEIIIHKDSRLIGPVNITIQDAGRLIIEENAGIRGVNFESSGATIRIGPLCMFSYGITVRNYDSHKVIDLKSGNITNEAKDIVLGRHVWICKNVSILKGVNIGDDSILGYGSIITKDIPANSIAAGVPATIVKENITWDY